MSGTSLARLKQPAAAAVASRAVGVLQRQCACGQHVVASGKCDECSGKTRSLQRRPGSEAGLAAVPSIVHDVLRSPGRPLDPSTRRFMEPRFGHDFSRVRVHVDAKASESAQAVNAAAYTVGRDVVFGAGQPAFDTFEGKRLLAHELTHVMQQSGTASQGYLKDISRSDDPAEVEADRLAQRILSGERSSGVTTQMAPTVQRTMLCSRPIQTSKIAGLFANHSWIDDTGRDDCQGAGQPGNYAVMDLVAGDSEAGCATKRADSPDPAGSTPKMKPCRPKAGVTDVHACLKAAYDSYPSPGFYSTTHGLLPWTLGGLGVGLTGGAVGGAALGVKVAEKSGSAGRVGAGIGLGVLGGVLGGAALGYIGMRIAGSQIGPNSNTFAGTLARACCADASDSGLGWVPAWDHAAPAACSAELLRQPPKLP